jgi:L-threonylcarbamoyladenylate synthase
MAQIISFSDFMQQKDFFVEEAKKGKIFIYPTDTIYGIGAVANEENILKISQIKKREIKKLISIIVPDFSYSSLVEGCKKYHISQATLQEQLTKYHGVTWIFSENEPGMRILKHDFQQFIKALNLPFLTTSVNISGNTPATSIDTVEKTIFEQVDYCIDA